MSADAVALSRGRVERTSSERTGAVLIRKAAVLGAGTMGSRIAAHLANAGIPVVLLDIVPPGAPAGDRAARNAVVMRAFDALKHSKPAAFFDAGVSRLISTGNFEDDLHLVGDCDWIIEAVAENLDIKRALLRKVDAVRQKGSIVTTNTSGLPVSQIAEGMPEDFRRNWLGAHFFNPPRYMRLLEIIPARDTDPLAVAAIERFAERALGKTVVRAKDTPNFIANRIGTFALMNAIRVMQAMDLTIEQVDALTGTALGWPKTGTFRLADMVGIDVLAHVARNFQERVKDERADVTLPEFVREMLLRGWLGDKTGQGFYKKVKEADGKQTIFALNWKTLEYHPSERAKFASLEMAKNAESVPERVKLLLDADPKKDLPAAFYWQILPELWNYAANRVPEISDDIAGIDAAMKAGFNWELGPFELWDAAGVPETVARMRAAGMPVAPAAEKLLASGFATWYRGYPPVASGRLFFDVLTGKDAPVPAAEGASSVHIVKRANGVVAKNSGASLVDLGDGIGCIEFHTKMNAIGPDIVSFVTQTLKPGGQAVANFDGFIILSDAPNFSAGANLMQLLLAIQEQEWDEIGLMIKAFQGMTQSIKFCPRPVVAAPFGMCLGGGAEVCLHAAARQAHAELYMGLVETGVGLIPAAGGCKEMTLRVVDAAASVRDGGRESVEVMEVLRRHFETVAMAKVSTSAVEARRLGYLSSSDGITMNRARLLTDAKARVREIADAGYRAPVRRTDIPAPGENLLASLKMGVHMMRKGEYISDFDARLGNAVAHVLCGGSVTPGTPVSEEYLLDLEREAFLSLCGEKKTQERIAFMLKHGKPLRN
jgi:3-hydroxyacyl-CoA dehydrogenase